MSVETGTTLAAAAVAAIDRGWPVFPVNGKAPRTANGFKDATRDYGRVDQWWRRWPDAGVAIPTGTASGVWVLDVDGEEGESSLRSLELEHGELPATVESLTGGGGRHLFFALPSGQTIRNKVGLRPGLDVRGEGGYVVIPPSGHPSGRAYAWEVSGHPEDLVPADAPAWLLELVGEAPRPERAPAAPEAIPSGERNATLASIAGTMRRRGLEAAEIAAALHTVNERRCRPPLPGDEVEQIAASVSRYPPEKPVGADRSPEGGDDHDQPPGEGNAPGAAHPEVRTLAELLADPDLLRPPRAVAPRFAWRGRVTLLAAREKRGKSTLAAACAGAVSRGAQLLDVACEAGPVLWLALEEHPADLARKLVAFGADPERVYILDRLRVPLADLYAAVEAVEPALVVVDTLPAFAGLMEDRPEPGSSSDWTRVMTGLAHVARDADVALLLLHHADKVRGQYRDSTAIGAGVDVIIEMQEDVDHAGVRKVETRARWKVGPWSYRLEGDPMDASTSPRLVLVEGGPTVREQIIGYVTANPGASMREVERAVTGRSRDVREAVHDLLRERVFVDEGGPRGGMALRPADNPHGHATDAVGTRSGHAPCPGGGTPPFRGVPPGRSQDTGPPPDLWEGGPMEELGR